MTKKLILIILSIASLKAMTIELSEEQSRAHTVYLAAKRHGEAECQQLLNIGYTEDDFFGALIEAVDKNDIPTCRTLMKLPIT